MNSSAPSFERLEQTVTMIAGHADYPGKDGRCRVLRRNRGPLEAGSISLEQRLRLYAILMRESSRALTAAV